VARAKARQGRSHVSKPRRRQPAARQSATKRQASVTQLLKLAFRPESGLQCWPPRSQMRSQPEKGTKWKKELRKKDQQWPSRSGRGATCCVSRRESCKQRRIEEVACSADGAILKGPSSAMSTKKFIQSILMYSHKPTRSVC